jgi:hypothetical protein
MKNYRKKELQPMEPWTPDYDMTGVSVWEGDTPEVGGMIAQNPKDATDRWYVAKAFFLENYELVE